MHASYSKSKALNFTPSLSKKTKTMTRRKIKNEKIEDKNSRKVTFTKRRGGLFGKAKKLCHLSGAEIAIVTFSLAGKPFSFGHPSVDSVIDCFLDDISGSSSSNESSRVNVHGYSSSSTSSSSKDVDSATSSSSKDVVGKEAGNSWWALPIESMDLDLDELQLYKTSLEVLISNVANRLHDMKDREARTRNLLGLLDAT